MDKETIKSLREKYKLSQADVAKLLGVHTLTVTGWESGRSQPTMNAAVLLEALATCSPETAEKAVECIPYGAWAVHYVLLGSLARSKRQLVASVMVYDVTITSRANNKASKSTKKGKGVPAWKRLRREDEQVKSKVFAALHNHFVASGTSKPPLPLDFELTKSWRKKGMDSDNLPTSFKAAQDTIARFFKVDDGDDTKVRWSYHQVEADQKFLRIDIFTRAPWI